MRCGCAIGAICDFMQCERKRVYANVIALRSIKTIKWRVSVCVTCYCLENWFAIEVRSLDFGIWSPFRNTTLFWLTKFKLVSIFTLVWRTTSCDLSSRTTTMSYLRNKQNSLSHIAPLAHGLQSLLVRLRLPTLLMLNRLESVVDWLVDRFELIVNGVSKMGCVIIELAVFDPFDGDGVELNSDMLGEFKRSNTCNGPKSLLLVRRWRLSSIFFFSIITTVDMRTVDSDCIHSWMMLGSAVNSISCWPFLPAYSTKLLFPSSNVKPSVSCRKKPR